MPDEIKIPQIKPEEARIEPQSVVREASVPATESKVLPVNFQGQNSRSIPNRFKPVMGKKFSKPLIIAGAFVVFLLALFFITFLSIKKASSDLMVSGKELKAAVSSQNIPLVREKITATKKSLTRLDKAISILKVLRPIPYLGNYVKDMDSVLKAGNLGLEAAEVAITATEPYLSILGFGNGGGVQEDSTKTTQERIDFVAKAIPDITPKMDEIAQKIAKANEYLSGIDPDKYPVKFKNYAVRESLNKYLEQFEIISSFVIKSKPLLEVAPYLLGLDSERKYLVVFQNDTELRPTGGFLTGYAIMGMFKSKFDNVSSNDIYNLDAKYKGSVEVPGPIAKYIEQPYSTSRTLRLRDMNWSPDFKTSMELFLKEAYKAGLSEVDGVIAVDTQTLVNFLDVIGPIGVPGYGNFSTEIVPECNCPQVIHELEKYADVEGPIVWFDGKIVFQPKNADNRKRIIGPLMNSVLANTLGQPKEKLPGIFTAAFKSLLEKHVLFYLRDDNVQKGVEAFGIAGRIEDFNEDYLHINDANLGGRKSNLYVKQEVNQVYETEKGRILKTVTITYQNTEKQDGWLNTVLPNWVRVYVPYQSELVSSEGLLDKSDPYDEFGKTVFSGYFELRPEGIAKVTFKYYLPIKSEKSFKLFVQKQPGTKEPLYTIESQRTSEEFYLNQDKKVQIKL